MRKFSGTVKGFDHLEVLSEIVFVKVIGVNVKRFFLGELYFQEEVSLVRYVMKGLLKEKSIVS